MPDKPYTDADVQALARVLYALAGENLTAKQEARRAFDHLASRGWAKRADVLREAADMLRQWSDIPKDAAASAALMQAYMDMIRFADQPSLRQGFGRQAVKGEAPPTA